MESRIEMDRRLEDLSRKIEEWTKESRERAVALARILEETRRDTVALAPPGADGSPLETLERFTRLAQASTDQTAILGQLIADGARVAPRVLLFAARGDALVGWSAGGFPPGFVPRQVTMSLGANSLLRPVVEECAVTLEGPDDREGNQALARALGGAPAVMMAAPMWVRDRVAAVLYADCRAGAAPWHPEVVALMASVASLCLEALPARAKHPRPAGSPMPRRTPAVLPGRSSERRPDPGPGFDPGDRGKRVPGLEPDATEGARSATAPDAPAGEIIDPEERRLHEEAKRFARLLVSEILLYNEQEIEEGRRSKDLYQRLKEDIERSRRMYEQRLSGKLAGAPDYFREELVRVLANGDESALAAPWD